MGEAVRASTNTKAAREAKPAIKLPKTETWLQPRLADSRNPYTSAPRPAVAINAPSQSILRAVWLRLSGMCHREITITAAARGTLMKKTQCHEACSINHPPSTGPSAVVIAVKPDQVPIARPRDSSSKNAL